jgi:hypothetical protein
MPGVIVILGPDDGAEKRKPRCLFHVAAREQLYDGPVRVPVRIGRVHRTTAQGTAADNRGELDELLVFRCQLRGKA